MGRDGGGSKSDDSEATHIHYLTASCSIRRGIWFPFLAIGTQRLGPGPSIWYLPEFPLYLLIMKGLFTSALCLLVSSAFASFELAILTDANTGFHRFDAETGIYLGVFGAGRSNGVLATWANQSTSRFYAMSWSGIQAFDYSTGDYLGYMNYAASTGYATNDTNGDFISVQGSNIVTRYALTGADSTYTLPTGTAARWISRNTDGKWYVGDSANGGRILRSTTTTLASSWSVVATGLAAAISPTAQNAVAAPTPGAPNFEHMIITHDTTSSRYFAFNSSYNFWVEGTFGLSTTTRNGIARGHFGQYHLGLISAGISQVRNFNDAGFSATTWTTDRVPNPTALTVVLAPEPGTIAAFGLGLAALWRKRKSR